MACAYAGGVERSVVGTLREVGEGFLQQDAAFATKCRQRANPAAHTELACEILCGISVDQAAAVTDIALKGLNQEGDMPAYEVWRQRIQLMFGQANSDAAINNP